MGRGRGVSATVIATLIAFVACIAPLREDEFLCEEAHAHLVECCPNFTTDSQYCSYAEGCGTAQYPALTADESQCIRDQSCDRLRSDGVCARAAAVHEQYLDADPHASPPPQGVCP
jgi:hypothetical protein